MQLVCYPGGKLCAAAVAPYSPTGRRTFPQLLCMFALYVAQQKQRSSTLQQALQGTTTAHQAKHDAVSNKVKPQSLCHSTVAAASMQRQQAASCSQLHRNRSSK
jgi:hypothetical protein